MDWLMDMIFSAIYFKKVYVLDLNACFWLLLRDIPMTLVFDQSFAKPLNLDPVPATSQNSTRNLQKQNKKLSHLLFVVINNEC